VVVPIRTWVVPVGPVGTSVVGDAGMNADRMKVFIRHHIYRVGVNAWVSQAGQVGRPRLT